VWLFYTAKAADTGGAACCPNYCRLKHCALPLLLCNLAATCLSSGVALVTASTSQSDRGGEDIVYSTNRRLVISRCELEHTKLHIHHAPPVYLRQRNKSMRINCGISIEIPWFLHCDVDRPVISETDLRILDCQSARHPGRVTRCRDTSRILPLEHNST
jgi:hypothetical protein